MNQAIETKDTRLKDARILKDFSQELLARKVGVTQQTISAYEMGTRTPPISIAKKLAATLDKTVTELFF